MDKIYNNKLIEPKSNIDIIKNQCNDNTFISGLNLEQCGVIKTLYKGTLVFTFVAISFLGINTHYSNLSNKQNEILIQNDSNKYKKSDCLTYTEVININKLAYNNPIINLSSQQKKCGEDVNSMIIRDKNVDIIKEKKLLTIAPELSEYDYYVKLPEDNVRIIECDLVKVEDNKFTVNWEA